MGMEMTNHPNRARAYPVAPPSPAEVRAARAAAGITQTEAAELVHSALRSWQQWEAEPGTADHRRMHPAIWELFRLKVLTRNAR
jgi:DNA (cytosine-5)-methyltransferase 1